ncbi:MAG: HypC/HybG/HupF family hydrogenase formation chaperone [Candidatus Woesearchaeota archaeon]
MCLAVPGKIVKIVDDMATIDYGPEQREAMIIEGEYSVGEYVIVQGKIVAMKIPEEEAKQALSLYQEAVGD